jgi:hypothetical protein
MRIGTFSALKTMNHCCLLCSNNKCNSYLKSTGVVFSVKPNWTDKLGSKSGIDTVFYADSILGDVSAWIDGLN